MLNVEEFLCQRKDLMTRYEQEARAYLRKLGRKADFVEQIPFLLSNYQSQLYRFYVQNNVHINMVFIIQNEYNGVNYNITYCMYWRIKCMPQQIKRC